MPAFIHTAEQEHLWVRAKAQAAEQGHAGDYAYVTAIFKKMGGLEKSLGTTIPPPFRPYATLSVDAEVLHVRSSGRGVGAGSGLVSIHRQGHGRAE